MGLFFQPHNKGHVDLPIEALSLKMCWRIVLSMGFHACKLVTSQHLGKPILPTFHLSKRSSPHRTFFITTLTLGSWPKQRLARVQAKRVAHESHLMPLRVWRNEPSHSQVSSRFGNWTPNGLPNLQRAITRRKTLICN
jgi:hypothetical protein